MLQNRNAAVIGKLPVSAEAKGRVRELAAALEISAGRMTAALERVPAKVLNPAYWKGRVGAERAIAKITRAIPVAPELSIPAKAVWRFIQPVPALPTADGEGDVARPGFIMMAIIAGSKGRLVRCESFGAAFTRHSIGRLLDRTAFRADPIAAMRAAHAAVTELHPPEGDRLFDLADAQMPAAGGAFLASPGRFGPHASPLLIARTWVDADMLYPDQAYDLQAWRTLLTQPIRPA